MPLFKNTVDLINGLQKLTCKKGYLNVFVEGISFKGCTHPLSETVWPAAAGLRVAETLTDHMFGELLRP